MFVALNRGEISRERWDGFVDYHLGGWFWHTSHWIDYTLAYTPGAIDRSFVLVEKAPLESDENTPIKALVALVEEGDTYSFGGNPGPIPLVMSVEAACAVDNVIDHLMAAHQIRRVILRGQPCRDISQYFLGPTKWTNVSWPTYVMNLQIEEAPLWAKLRKSYHSLIHRAERNYTFMSVAKPWGVELAHTIHRLAAGRESRSQKTWDLMARWADLGHVVVALALNEHQIETTGETAAGLRARAMAMAIRYKDYAYYASGASLDRDLSHALIWHLAKTLKCGGIREFDVGWGARPHDTTKDRNISFFKAGFGGEKWMVPSMEFCRE